MASLFEQLRDIEVGIQANGEKPKAWHWRWEGLSGSL
jgi:hypothetical protein